MRINFFEEYPTEENMAKLDFVDWPAIVFIAASSLREFEIIREKYRNKYRHITFGWWPIILSSYWISGFTYPADLDRLFTELTFKRYIKEFPILIDFELPIKNYFLLKNILYIIGNKKRISKFFTEAPQYNLKVYTAEYPVLTPLLRRFFLLLGISISFSFPHTKLPMCYSSIIKKYFGEWIWERIKKFERQFARLHIDRIGFGIGTTATGSIGNEPILTPQEFTSDLAWAKECGVKEVFIFRLGGLNESYVSVLEKFAEKE